MFTRQSSEGVLAEVTLYEVLSTPDGYREFRTAICNLLAKSDDEVADQGISDVQLNFLGKQVFGEWDEGLTQTVLDVFDGDSRMRLDVTQIYVLFLLACAVESRQAVYFLHKFGKALFDMTAARSQGLAASRLTTLASLLFDKTAVEIQRMLQKIGIDKEEIVTFSDFELFLFDSIRSCQSGPGGDCRTYAYEYSAEKQSVRFLEIKKPKQNSGVKGLNLVASSSMNRCALI